VAEEEHTRARRDRVVEEVQNLRGIFHGAGKRDLLHDDAVAFGFQVPRMFTSGMFLIGHEDFIPGLHVDAVGDVAVRFGGVAQ
jgi:hypothetical protein